MCAIRLNWMADLPFDQGIVGLNERNPCFPGGVHVGEGVFSVGDNEGIPGSIIRFLTKWDITVGNVGDEEAREYRKMSRTRFSNRAPFCKRRLLMHFKSWHVTAGIGTCAEFMENGCKFIFISLLRALIGKIYVRESKVRN